MHITADTCLGSGYQPGGGCAPPGGISADSSCYCDSACYEADPPDCCDDVIFLGCMSGKLHGQYRGTS